MLYFITVLLDVKVYDIIRPKILIHFRYEYNNYINDYIETLTHYQT